MDLTRKYHLGCGTKYLQGYINVDFPQSEHTIVTIKADLYSDLLILDYKPCDEIRSHHVFEHFNYMESLALLIKWTRALMIGGLLRIDIPDIERLYQGFIALENSAEKSLIFTRMIYGSHEAEWAYHVNGWTESSLTFVLRKLGYSFYTSNRYGNIKSDFPNCGIDMIFKKSFEINNLKDICYEILKLYTHSSDEKKLHEFYCNELNKLC